MKKFFIVFSIVSSIIISYLMISCPEKNNDSELTEENLNFEVSNFQYKIYSNTSNLEE